MYFDFEEFIHRIDLREYVISRGYEFEQDAHIHLDLPQRLIEEMNEEAEEELKRLNKNG